MLITHIVFPLCLQNKPLLLETPNCAQFTQTEALEVQKKKDVRRMKRIEGIPPPPHHQHHLTPPYQHKGFPKCQQKSLSQPDLCQPYG